MRRLFWFLLLAADAPLTAHAEPPVTAGAFPPGGGEVVLGSQAGVSVRAWPGLEEVRRIETKLEHLHDLAFSPDGAVLAIAGGSPGASGEVELRRWPGGELVAHAAPHADLVYCVAWRPEGGLLASASADHSVRLLANDTLAVERELTGHSRPALAVAWWDGDTLLSGGADNTLRVWGAATGKQLRGLDNHTAAVAGLAVRVGTDDRPALAASIGADLTLRIWRPDIGRLVRFARLESEPLAVAWTADGNRLAVTSADGRLRLVDPATAKITADLEAVPAWAYTLAVGPDGDFLVAGADGQAVRVTPPRPAAGHSGD